MGAHFLSHKKPHSHIRSSEQFLRPDKLENCVVECTEQLDRAGAGVTGWRAVLPGGGDDVATEPGRARQCSCRGVLHQGYGRYRQLEENE